MMSDWYSNPNSPAGVILSFDFGYSPCLSTNSLPTSSPWPSANRALFVPFRLWSPIIAVNMFVANGGPVTGSIDVGIYNIDGARLVSQGSTLQAGVSGTQVLDIPDIRLDIGLYYLAMVSNSAVAQFMRRAPNSQILQSFGWLQMNAAFPLPAMANFASYNSGYVPVFGIGTNITI